MHNFLDGIAVGITFLIGSTQGITTTIAVFIHELPHEIGDFAVLLKGGFSVKKAYLMQIASASAAFMGALFAIYAGEYLNIRDYCLPFVVGNFIYLSLTAMGQNMTKHTSHFFGVSIFFMLGIACMYGIIFLE
jgi:zinc transporter ZupT